MKKSIMFKLYIKKKMNFRNRFLRNKKKKNVIVFPIYFKNYTNSSKKFTYIYI